MEDGLPTSNQTDQPCLSGHLKLTLLLVNSSLMLLGTGGPLLLRIYFLHGGSRMWLSSLIQIGGWPVLLIPLSISHLHRRRHDMMSSNINPESRYVECVSITRPLIAACGLIGLLTGLDCYLMSFGMAYLPISTSALLSSTEVAFVSLFALLIVKHRFTPFSVNSIVLLTLGAVVLGVGNNSGDRPVGVSRYQYSMGFVMTIVASALYGFMLPFVEMIYTRTKQKITYAMVMEMQIAISVFATAFCVVGMIVNRDFQVISKEAKEYELGEGKYYTVVILGSVFWQMYNLGLMGIISCSSSLFAGVLGAALLPVAEIIALVFLHERFDSDKGVSLVLSLWGFFSYWYGDLQQIKEEKLKRKNSVEVQSST